MRHIYKVMWQASKVMWHFHEVMRHIYKIIRISRLPTYEHIKSATRSDGLFLVYTISVFFTAVSSNDSRRRSIEDVS